MLEYDERRAPTAALAHGGRWLLAVRVR